MPQQRFIFLLTVLLQSAVVMFWTIFVFGLLRITPDLAFAASASRVDRGLYRFTSLGVYLPVGQLGSLGGGRSTP